MLLTLRLVNFLWTLKAKCVNLKSPNYTQYLNYSRKFITHEEANSMKVDLRKFLTRTTSENLYIAIAL